MKKLLLVAAILSVAACTKKTETQPTAALSNTIVISTVGESMVYDKTELSVKAGEKITLTFKNPSSTLKHNWLLVQPGKENDVGIEGIKAGEAKGYIPETPAVLAHTKLVEPKSEETITFTAPPAGDYPYICTFPGHHTIMKGVLHSK